VIAISNSSPLMNLAAIGRLHLVQRKYGTVIVPEAVWREVVIDGKGKRGVEEIDSPSAKEWIKVQPVRDRALVNVLAKDLDLGESEAITLALEHGADVILLDDKAARIIAATLGLNVIGVIGILIWARKQGLIERLGEELQNLRERAHFWMSSDVIKRALEEVDER
jgi:predicted nucleic acid-binding protein